MQGAAKQLRLFTDFDEPGDTPGFSIRESARAKRLSIKVFPRGRVEVIVPKRTKAADVQVFVAEHQQWIEDSRASFAKLHPPEPFALPTTVDLLAVERQTKVRYELHHEEEGVRFRQSRDAVVLKGRTDDEKLCVAALKRWLSSVAKKEFRPLLESLSALTDNPFERMQVRGQRTCWGSHSCSGTISLNYCLLFLEPALLRYLMIHELCHARHMNHSRRFWQRVRRYEPDYRKLDKALSEAWKDVPHWLGYY